MVFLRALLVLTFLKAGFVHGESPQHSIDSRQHLVTKPRTEDFEAAMHQALSLRAQEAALLQRLDRGEFPNVQLPYENPIGPDARELVEATRFLGLRADPFSLVIGSVLARYHAEGALHSPEQIELIVKLLRGYGSRMGYGDGKAPQYQDPEYKLAWEMVGKFSLKTGAKIEDALRAGSTGAKFLPLVSELAPILEVGQARDAKIMDGIARKLIAHAAPDIDPAHPEQVDMGLMLLLASSAMGGPSEQSRLASYAFDKAAGGYTNHGRLRDPEFRKNVNLQDFLAQQRLVRSNASLGESHDQLKRQNADLERRARETGARLEARDQARFALELEGEVGKMKMAAAKNPRLLDAAKKYEDAIDGLRRAANEHRGDEASRQRMAGAQRDFVAASREVVNQAIEESANETSRAAAGQVIQAVAGLGHAAARLVGLKDPKAAQIMGAMTNFAAGIGMSIVAGGPLMFVGMAAALGNLMADLLAGPSEMSLVLQAIGQLRKDVEDLRKEMHQRFNHLDDQLQKTAIRNLTIMLDEFDGMKRQLRSEFHHVNEMQMQTHGELHELSHAVATLQRQLGETAKAHARDNAALAFKRVLTDDLKPRPGLKKGDFSDGAVELVFCATEGMYGSVPARIKGQLIDDLSAEELPVLFKFFAQGNLRSDAMTSSLEFLPLLNSTYSKLGVPLWDKEDSQEMGKLMPNAAMWAFCADKYLQLSESPDPRIQKWFAEFAKGEGKGDAAAATRAVMRVGEKAHRAVSQLGSDPRALQAAFGQLRGQVAHLKRQTMENYSNALAGNGGKGSLHAGPFQRPWHRPTFASTQQENLANVYYCEEDKAALAESGMTKELRHGIRIPDVQALLNTLPTELIHAEALNLGTLRMCVSSAEWVHNPALNTTSPNFGTMFDWNQQRHGKLKLKFKVYSKDRVVNEFTWLSPKDEFYETRTLFFNTEELAPFIEASFANAGKEVLDRYRLPFRISGGAFKAQGPAYTEFVHTLMVDLKWDVSAAMRDVFEKAVPYSIFDTVNGNTFKHKGVIKTTIPPGNSVAKAERNAEIVDGLKNIIESKRRVDPIALAVGRLHGNGLPEETKKAVGRYHLEWEREIKAFFPSLPMLAGDGSFIDGKDLEEMIEEHAQKMLARLDTRAAEIFGPMEEGSEDGVLAAHLKRELMKATHEVSKSYLDPQMDKSFKSQSVAIAVERELRNRALLAEKGLRDAMNNRNGKAELEFANGFDAYEGARNLIQISAETVTALPSRTTGLSKFAVETDKEGFPQPVPAEALSAKAGSQYSLYDKADVFLLSRSGLPMYSPSGPDVFKMWEKNINESEATMRARFDRARLRTSSHPLLESLLNRGRDLEEKQIAEAAALR